MCYILYWGVVCFCDTGQGPAVWLAWGCLACLGLFGLPVAGVMCQWRSRVMMCVRLMPAALMSLPFCCTPVDSHNQQWHDVCQVPGALMSLPFCCTPVDSHNQQWHDVWQAPGALTSLPFCCTPVDSHNQQWHDVCQGPAGLMSLPLCCTPVDSHNQQWHDVCQVLWCHYHSAAHLLTAITSSDMMCVRCFDVITTLLHTCWQP